MSGIAGIIHFDGKPIEPGLIEKMTGAMAYRGPDGINHWVKGSVALGQCMLRTTPESLEEHQPLTNEDESLVLVMDGRVDNWEELRRELLRRGAVLRNRADAELVLRAYEIWGRDCLAHIDGDFALVIWDTRRQEAFCARDRMGIKPFTYNWADKTFVFASELHSILALPWIEAVLNEGILAEFLAEEWFSMDETLWMGVLRLLAGHHMTARYSGLESVQYWKPNIWEDLRFQNDQAYFDRYRELLMDTVRRLSRSHRPVSYEVSGGLDSSAVFCLAAQLSLWQQLPASGLNAYTLAFTDDSKANEVEYARSVGEHLGMRIHEVSPSIMPLAWYFERAQTSRNFPGYPNGMMHRSLCHQVSQAGGVALLTGIGGDHWLDGTRAYYAEELARGNWRNLLGMVQRDTRIFGPKKVIEWISRHGVFPLLPTAIKSAIRPIVGIMRGKIGRDASWLSPRLRTVLAARRAIQRPYRKQRLRTRGQYYLLETFHYAFDYFGMELGDRIGADFGIEIRHPMRTANFVQFAFSTPERLRLCGDIFKFIHVQSLTGILPQRILERKTKADFSNVFSVYVDNMQELFCEHLPRKRADWLDIEGTFNLYRSYHEHPELGWQNWVLWNILGCDQVMS